MCIPICVYAMDAHQVYAKRPQVAAGWSQGGRRVVAGGVKGRRLVAGWSQGGRRVVAGWSQQGLKSSAQADARAAGGPKGLTWS